MKIRLSHAIMAIIGLGLVAIYGGVFRLYTFIKFIPLEKWFSTPYMVAVTLSVFGGLVGAVGLTALTSFFLKDLHRIENISTDVKVNTELERRLTKLTKELADTKEEARFEIESLEQRKKEGEKYVEELFDKKVQHDKEMQAEADATSSFIASLSGSGGGEKQETPPSPQEVNVQVTQSGGCAGCGWVIFAILVALIISSAIWWAQVMAFFRF